MAVYKTESQIPGGIENISRLCDFPDVQGSVALISYLPAPIRYIASTRELAQNTYVVMFERPPTTNVTYTWRLKLHLPGQSDDEWFYKHEWPNQEEGVFELDSAKTEEIWCIQDAVKVTVEVDLDPGPKLRLSREIVRASEHVDHLEQQNTVSNASAGRPFVTKLVEASMVGFFDRLDDLDPVVGTEGNDLKRRVITSIIYNTYVQFYVGKSSQEYQMMNNGQSWHTYLRQENAQRDWLSSLVGESGDDFESVGVCGVRPEVLAMFVTSAYLGGTPALVPFTTRPEGDLLEYNFDVVGNFARLIEGKPVGSQNPGIDLYNLLRFPKSSITMCGLLLEQVKMRRANWRDRSWNSLVLERDGQLMMLLEDFLYGPSEISSARKKRPKDIVKRLQSPYVTALSSSDLCVRMRGDFYAGIPDKNAQNSKYLSLLEEADEVLLNPLTKSTMLHMENLDEQYQSPGGDGWPIYYGGYEIEHKFVFTYGFGVSQKQHTAEFKVTDFIVNPNYSWSQTNYPETQLKPIGRKVHDLNRKIMDIDAQIEALSQNDPSLPALWLQRGRIQAELDALGYEFIARIIRAKHTYGWAEYSVHYEEISIDDQGLKETGLSTSDHELALELLDSQIRLFYLAAMATYCTAKGQSDTIVKILSRHVRNVETLRSYYQSIADRRDPPEQLLVNPSAGRGTYALHPLRFQRIPMALIDTPIPVPTDESWQIPRAILDKDSFFRINKFVLFALDRPTPSDLSSGETASVLASADEEIVLEDVFDQFFADIGRSSVLVKLVIIGYADKSFGAETASDREIYNRNLSKRRARWTRDRFLAHISKRNAEIDAGIAQPNLRIKVETAGENKNFDGIDVRWCGDKHAPGIPGIDPPESLKRPEYRDVRMILMPTKAIPGTAGGQHL